MFDASLVMGNQSILIGIAVGVFFAGLGIGYVISQVPAQVNTMQDPVVEANLARFDELDFEAFSKQDWELFNQIHDPNVLVVWPDGRQTRGIEQHDNDIMAMFVYAPDTRINSHPIKFGSGDWTVATGVIEGTFTQPMPLPDGSSIPPTGKAFKVTMTTIARWEDGRIMEEHLFWDNAEIMKQMGLAQ